MFKVLILVKLLNSVSFNKCIYKELIMANQIKEDVKKKIIIINSLPIWP